MPNRWYVVQSKPNKESTVVHHLENQNFKCYLPQFRITRRVHGEDVECSAPMFPSYLFVQFDVGCSRWRSINGTRGVLRLLAATEDSVSPLPAGFIEDMMMKSDKNGFITLEKAEQSVLKFAVGDTVRVKDGVLQGFSGTCTSIRKDCAVVFMTLLSGQVGVKLPLNVLEAA